MRHDVHSTGLPALDRLIGGLQPGDNVVWQIDALDQYQRFSEPFLAHGLLHRAPVYYFRFARHEPVVPPRPGVQEITLSAQGGFEHFIDAIHAVVARQQTTAFYIFDCLSDLAVDWFSDLMLGNFFMLTCPYIYQAGHLAYFALLRNRHSNRATTPIRETTQLFIDAYTHNGHVYLRPIKAQQREASGVAVVHRWRPGTFEDVTDSSTIADILTSSTRSALESTVHPLDVWHRSFLQVEQTLRAPKEHSEVVDAETHERLLRMVLTRDPRILALARRWLTIEEVLAIGRRTIGSGLIGGKAIGMLLARAILARTDPAWENLLETHDSFYVASDVFYTYLVRNGCWGVRRDLKQHGGSFAASTAQARQRMLTGYFPEDVMRQFAEMLDYFGQSPIIVRSSSLLEDDFGNSFAGKYESIFCANQGTPHQRLEKFLAAVRTIYASALSEEALHYRARRGLLERDEQMALLVQRVSGARRGKYFFPQLAGAAYSFNPYVWSDYIDPRAGVVRLVFGLGTRAVDRTDDDYTRVVALNAPERFPGADRQGKPRMYFQRKADVLDLDLNEHVALAFEQLWQESGGMPGPPLAKRVPLDAAAGRTGRGATVPLVDFSNVLEHTTFVEHMRQALATVEQAYEHPVEVEFAANFYDDQHYKIHLLQCRPFQFRGNAPLEGFPEGLPEDRVLFAGDGPVIGHSRVETLDRVVWVSPDQYALLPQRERYSVARALGHVMRSFGSGYRVLLAGPGRWGTSTPALGVPVSFAEITNAAVLVEIVTAQGDVVPDVSLGTHFFSEMIETDMLYIAIYPDRDTHALRLEQLDPFKIALTDHLDDGSRFESVIHIADLSAFPLQLFADPVKQRVICYWANGETPTP